MATTYRRYKELAIHEAKQIANRNDSKGWAKLTPEQQAVAVYEKADGHWDNADYEVTKLERELAEARAEQTAARKARDWAWEQLKKARKG